MNDLAPERKTNRTLHYQRATSSHALESLIEQGVLGKQQEAVLRAWETLWMFKRTPCSVKTAAQLIENSFGEYYFSKRSRNEDVMRKRTSELVQLEYVEEILFQIDNDGVKRNHYIFKAKTSNEQEELFD